MKVETEGMLTIGRFARVTGDRQGAPLLRRDRVLHPAHVDSWTGYRGYGTSQVREAVAVRGDVVPGRGTE
jgi:hypothetical protein